MAIQNRENVFNTVSLFKTVTELVQFDVDKSADLYSRDLIYKIKNSDQDGHSESPDVAHLVSEAEAFCKTIIYSSLLLRENSRKIELKAHTLKNLSITDSLFQGLSGLGSVDLAYYGVNRIISVELKNKKDLMSTDEIETYNFMLVRFFKGTDVTLVKGVPFHKEGDEDKMSLLMAADDSGEIHMASHVQCSAVDAQDMATMFPNLVVKLDDGIHKSVSKRIPVSISHQPHSKLLRNAGFIPDVNFEPDVHDPSLENCVTKIGVDNVGDKPTN